MRFPVPAPQAPRHSARRGACSRRDSSMRRWWAAWIRCALRRCMVSTRCSFRRGRPAARSTSRATGSPSARRRHSLFSNAHRTTWTAARCCCSASANPATPIICRRRIPRVSVHAGRCAPRSSPPRSNPATSTTSICTVPGRRATIGPRVRRSPAYSARPRPAVRPRAPPVTPWVRPARSRRSSAPSR